ncbi:DNA binding protein [Gordonia phage Obliviate]|uniref:DNA binding protein n=1 Tax=Gordonia phage Obliviate TaxID=1821559 RepID=UPI00078CA99E|nr:DNA binding protein [Gordonia phage Obliviate]AMS03152.1 hypothetical protein SEA_OBLIVIATE_73 [Gordonia phage Obliviate]
MTGRDIVDDIDALIDEQLAAGESGQARRAADADRRCGHCGRAWHGLAITTRMEEMRREYLTNVVLARMRGEEYEYAESAILGDYRHADDDSTVLCPGSEFIGPLPSTCDATASLTDDDGCQCPNCLMWRAVFGGGPAVALRGLWQLPDDFDPASWLTRSIRDGRVTPELGQWRGPARWWRLDIPAHRHLEEIEFELNDRDEADEWNRPQVTRRGPFTLVMRVGSGLAQIQGITTLEPDRENDLSYAFHTYDAVRRPLTLDVHAERPNDMGGRIVWHEIDGPGGDYVRSRAVVSTSRVDRWFDELGLWFLAPREMRAVGRRLMGFALDDGGPIRPARTRIPGGAPYLPADIAMPQRGDTVGYEIGGRVYTGVVTAIDPGERSNEYSLTVEDRSFNVREVE